MRTDDYIQSRLNSISRVNELRDFLWSVIGRVSTRISKDEMSSTEVTVSLVNTPMVNPLCIVNAN